MEAPLMATRKRARTLSLPDPSRLVAVQVRVPADFAGRLRVYATHHRLTLGQVVQRFTDPGVRSLVVSDRSGGGADEAAA
jgi:hypothetical protein